MLKTLQITSLVVLILAVCGVFLVIFLGLRKDPEIIAYLDSPGVVSKFQGQGQEGDNKGLESPLVAQAAAYKLRIDPPPPPAPPKKDPPKREIPQKKVVRTPTPKVTPPAPKVPTSAKFSLLATVMCEADPSRSMVLLRQAGGKNEWFWEGDTVGQLQVAEVRDGSAVFSKNGLNPQELFVPAKPKTKSLLKADAGSTGPRSPSGGSISVLIDPVDPVTGDPVEAGEGAVAATNTIQRSEGVSPPRRSIPTERNTADVSAMRQEVSSRIRRIRTVPKPPSPAEQKESIESSISSIQEIMNRDDAGLDEEQRKVENEAWIKLLNSLQERKEEIEQTAPAADEEQAASSQAGDEGGSEAETPTPDNREE